MVAKYNGKKRSDPNSKPTGKPSKPKEARITSPASRAKAEGGTAALNHFENRRVLPL